ncbi:hypothetical protein RRSWK_01611 [Rhodopirellula sp. SWK7]|nr:hypothetical protein RRSWK_01611 [Rhodopirellula sp. SWK7]
MGTNRRSLSNPVAFVVTYSESIRLTAGASAFFFIQTASEEQTRYRD